MSGTVKELNSKQWISGNTDVWWYNISSPSKLSNKDRIQLNLWDSMNRKLVKSVVLDLKDDRLSRIRQPSTHFYRGRARASCQAYLSNIFTGKIMRKSRTPRQSRALMQHHFFIVP